MRIRVPRVFAGRYNSMRNWPVLLKKRCQTIIEWRIRVYTAELFCIEASVTTVTTNAIYFFKPSEILDYPIDWTRDISA